jgi:hypothetical protein
VASASERDVHQETTGEKLMEEELEEARLIQSAMMPAESLRVGAVTISHQSSRLRQSAAIFWTISN